MAHMPLRLSGNDAIFAGTGTFGTSVIGNPSYGNYFSADSLIAHSADDQYIVAQHMIVSILIQG